MASLAGVLQSIFRLEALSGEPLAESTEANATHINKLFPVDRLRLPTNAVVDNLIIPRHICLSKPYAMAHDS